MRKAFRMMLDPGEAGEYERRHQRIWRELEATLIQHGVRTYSIFLDPATNDLFGYAEVESQQRWDEIAATEVCQRWWRYMREIMPTSPDGSPVSRELREVFHIEATADVSSQALHAAVDLGAGNGRMFAGTGGPSGVRRDPASTS